MCDKMSDKDEKILKLIKQLKSAYRKFKSYTYYDTYGAINRAKIANFEAEELISISDDYFEALAEHLIDKDKRKILFEELVKKIGVICYPKSIKSSNESIQITTDEDPCNKFTRIKLEKISPKCLGNIPDDSNEIEKLNYFIDLDVKTHILGTLWILRSGWILDDRLHKNCHGNRINKEVLSKIISEEKKGHKYSEPTTFLFEPYFKKYQTWRDEGLNTVEQLLDKKNNAIMLALDFKEYYYTSTINFEKLLNDIEKAKGKILDNYEKEPELDVDLTLFIKDIFVEYTNYFERQYYDKLNLDLPMIPIGFLPSLIISNWNLQAFDQSILDIVNPAYYGRYVDDILIVFKSHTESKSCSKENFTITADDVIKKYLIHNHSDSDHKQNILKIGPKLKEYSVNSLYEKEKRYKLTDKSKPNRHHSDYENLRIQPEKIKIFRFTHDNSKALIENFKKEIYRNSSEFRLMHTVEKLYADVSRNIFSIRYAESINKISDIESVKLNKFELSKTLSWLIRSSIYETNSVSKDNITNILYAFSGSKKIEFMILWEKFIEFLFIEKKYEILEEEIKKILSKISDLNFKTNHQSTYNFKSDDENLLKESLIKFLYFTLTRVISLKKTENDNIKNVLKLFEDLDKNIFNDYDGELPEKYVFSYLYKSSSMRDPLALISGFPSDFIIDTTKDIKFNFPKYDLIKPDNLCINKETNPYLYYPRYIQFHETTVHEIDKILKKSDDLEINEYLESATTLYHLTNGFKEKIGNKDNPFYKTDCGAKIDSKYKCKFNKSSDVTIINVGSNNKKKVNVGLINTALKEDIYYKALKGSPNRSSERLDKIADIINEAIKRKVEFLVMPEMYIPYEWIPGILDVSRTHNMAMVFGIEPAIFGNIVGNYIGIALPSETKDKHQNCTFIMRLKNSYSPEELREYRKYGLKPKRNNDSNYVLCIWNDVYFAPYYCYEIANINDRALFKSCCDIVVVSEFNKDTSYFTAIAESLSRDLLCYCVKVNSSQFGGTCIIQPSKNESKYLINLKGGNRDYVVTHTLNINKLRNHQILAYESEVKDTELKPRPPGFEDYRVRARMKLPSHCPKK